jgi:hypothetical protein
VQGTPGDPGSPGIPGPTGPTGPSGVTTPVFPDNLFRVSDNLDLSKQLAFQVGTVSASQTRTLTVPDADTTIVGTDVAQTLTRKTLQAANGAQSAAVVKGATSQNAPLLVLQDSGGNEILRLDGNGANNTWVGQSAGAGQGGNGNVAVGDTALQNNTGGSDNTAIGYEALAANVLGGSNTAVGRAALRNTVGSSNTGVGLNALQGNTTGNRNTAIGTGALSAGGYVTADNTAVGNQALQNTTTGPSNSALGSSALQNNVSGSNNTAVGRNALRDNTASNNTAVGAQALQSNATGGANTALGSGALAANISGSENLALGGSALANNTIGQGNVAVGNAALQATFSSSNSTAVGWRALEASTSSDNTAVGAQALRSNFNGVHNAALGSEALRNNVTGNRNTAVGFQALAANTSGDSNTAVGFQALTGTNFTNTSGIGINAVVTNNDQVQLGNSATTTFAFGAVQNRSDARDKADVRDTALGLDFITALRPVDFRWDMRDDYRPSPPEAPGPEATQPERLAYEGALHQWAKAAQLGNLTHDGSQKRSRFHHGLIAQDVADVIARTGIDFGGYQDHTLTGGDDVRSLGYEEFIAPLIKAIQELAAKNAALELRLAALENSRSE